MSARIKKNVRAGSLFLAATSLLGACTSSVEEGYQPKKSIDFPHSVHMQLEDMTCSTCHKTTADADAPLTENVCLNCHNSNNGIQL